MFPQHRPRARLHVAANAAAATGIAALAVLFSPLPVAGFARHAAEVHFARAVVLGAATGATRAQRAASAAAAAAAAWLWAVRRKVGRGAAPVLTFATSAALTSSSASRASDGRAHALAVLFCTACLVARDAWRQRQRAGVPDSVAFRLFRSASPPLLPASRASSGPAPPPARCGDGLGALRAALRASLSAGGDTEGAATAQADLEEAHARSALADFLRASPLFSALCGVAVVTTSATGGGGSSSTEWSDDGSAAWLAPHPPAAAAAEETEPRGCDAEEEVVSVAFVSLLDPCRLKPRVVALSAWLVHGSISYPVGTVSLVFPCADAPAPGSYEHVLLGAARCVGEHVAARRSARAAADAAAQLAAALAVVCDIYPAGVAARLTERASVGRLSVGRHATSRLSAGRASNFSRLSAFTTGKLGETGDGGGGDEAIAQPHVARRSCARLSSPGHRYSMSALKAGALAAAAVWRTSAGAEATAAMAVGGTVEEAGEGVAAAAVAAQLPPAAASASARFSAHSSRHLRRSASVGRSRSCSSSPPPPSPPRQSHSVVPGAGRPSVSFRRALAARAGALDPVWQLAAASLPPPRRFSQPTTPPPNLPLPASPPPRVATDAAGSPPLLVSCVRTAEPALPTPRSSQSHGAAPRRSSFDLSQLRTRSRSRSPAPHPPALPRPGSGGGGWCGSCDDPSYRWIGAHPAFNGCNARGSVSCSARLSGSSENATLPGRLAEEAARREGSFQGTARRMSASDALFPPFFPDGAAAAAANARGGIRDPNASRDGLLGSVSTSRGLTPRDARAPDARAAAALPFRTTAEDELFVEHHDNVSIVFADVVGFTTLCETSTPLAVMTMLHALFSHLDELCELCGLYKVCALR